MRVPGAGAKRSPREAERVGASPGHRFAIPQAPTNPLRRPLADGARLVRHPSLGVHEAAAQHASRAAEVLARLALGDSFGVPFLAHRAKTARGELTHRAGERSRHLHGARAGRGKAGSRNAQALGSGRNVGRRHRDADIDRSEEGLRLDRPHHPHAGLGNVDHEIGSSANRGPLCHANPGECRSRAGRGIGGGRPTTEPPARRRHKPPPAFNLLAAAEGDKNRARFSLVSSRFDSVRAASRQLAHSNGPQNRQIRQNRRDPNRR
jgi:hypothetical protein